MTALWAALRRMSASVPLSLRVALVVGPSIMAAQLVVMRVFMDVRPIVDVFLPDQVGPGFHSFMGGRGPGEVGFAQALPAQPSMRLELPRDRALMLPPRAWQDAMALQVPYRLPPEPMLTVSDDVSGGVSVMSPFEARRAFIHRQRGKLQSAVTTAAQVPLVFGPDGAPLVSIPMMPLRARPLQPPWQHLWLILGTTAVLVWAALAWVLRPMARLADAAESLGRDVHQQPLQEAGPPEVRRAAAAFNRMQDRLLRFLRGRSDAMLAMSHDLKTPITRLRLRAELLPEALRGDFANDIALLQKRIDEALAFMRGVHSEEPMQEVDVHALAATVVEQLQDTGADVSLSGSAAPLSCRQTQFERALTNLVENAVRYAGSAEVELIDSRQQLAIVVRDRGAGVPEHLLHRLTDPFFRVDTSRSRDSGGTGLGLAIVKDIVESLGGKLILRNRAGGGFEARMNFPRRS